MENRIQCFFLRGLLALCALAASSGLSAAQVEDVQAETSRDKIFTPKVERREIDRDAIDTENWELGLYYGIISIEDFGSHELKGFRGAYHVTEDFFVELSYAQTKAGKTSFELLNGDVLLLADKQREYSHYNIALGFNVMPGEGFIGRDLAFTSSLYLLTALGSTDFAGDKRSTIMVGGGYRVLFNDWLAMHLTLKDHFYDTELLGISKRANDLEISTSFTIFF